MLAAAAILAQARRFPVPPPPPPLPFNDGANTAIADLGDGWTRITKVGGVDGVQDAYAVQASPFAAGGEIYGFIRMGNEGEVIAAARFDSLPAAGPGLVAQDHANGGLALYDYGGGYNSAEYALSTSGFIMATQSLEESAGATRAAGSTNFRWALRQDPGQLYYPGGAPAVVMGGEVYLSVAISTLGGFVDVKVDLPPPPPNLHTDPTFATDSAWTPSGSGVAVTGGQVVFNAAASSDTLGLNSVAMQGALRDALNAALADNTSYNVTLGISGWASGSAVLVRLKGGAFARIAVTGNGEASALVTTGALTAHRISTPLQSADPDASSFSIDYIRIQAL